MPKAIPEILKNHILPFNWDVRKVWAIEAEVVQVPCSEFTYLLELPLWSSVPKRGLLFNVRPIEVIRDPSVSTYQARRLDQTELEYPIDILLMQDRRWVLDGVHRIAKHFILKHSTIPIRYHNENFISEIKSN